jgi:hypothetical protein
MQNAMTAHRGMEVKLHVGVILIDRGEWLSPASGCYTSQGDTGNQQTEGWVGPETSLEQRAKRMIPVPVGNGTPILQPANLFTDTPLFIMWPAYWAMEILRTMNRTFGMEGQLDYVRP